MKGGDAVIEAPVSGGESSEVIAEVTADNVFSDLLRGEETQRVKEFRDRYYRVYLESKKYKYVVDAPKGDRDSAWEDVFNPDCRRMVKIEGNTKNKPKIMEDDSPMPVLVIQDSTIDNKGEVVDVIKDKKVEGVVHSTVVTDIESCIFKIERNGFIPRILIEPYIKRVVVKKIDDTHSRLELYLPFYTRQFYKKDSLVKSEIERIRNGSKSDLFDFESFLFITDNAWGTTDLRLFHFNDLVYENIDVFDGSYVVSFNCSNVLVDYDVTEQYRLKEVDEKYAEMAPNEGVAVDLETAERRLEKLKKRC